MTEVADLYVVLRSVGAKFEEGMARAGASAEVADSKIAGVGRAVRTMSLAVVGGGLLVAGEAVKMASEFDRLMEQLHTLAHVPQGDLKQLSAGVLDVAGKVGFAPNSLAEALYHIESSFASVGITSKNALGILQTAAKGAQIGGADLTDVVNALDAAVVSGIPGVKNINQAMGALLATVGAGDMTMQNLAEALGSGILAVAKQYGATLKDVGAGLAVLGDNNIRGAKAATDLRMAIMDLTMQSDKSAKFLKDHLGLAVGQLGQDMQKGGLNKALLDLHAHLDAAGIKGVAVGRVLEEAFTKKSSAPLAILLGELKQFESKYPELAKGANSFGDSWKKTSELMSTKMKMAKANIESAFIGLGHMLMPIAMKIADAFNGAFEWAKTHKKTIQELADKLKYVLVGAAVLAGVALAGVAIEAAIAAAPFIIVAAAVGALVLWFKHLYDHSAKVREFVQTIVTGFKRDATIAVHWLINAFHEARKIIGEVIDAIIGFYHRHQATINRMVGDVVSVLKDVGQVFQDGFDAVKAIVMTVVKIIEDLWDRFGKHIWAHVVTAWNAIVQVIRGVLQYLKGIFDMITGILTGNWGKFWKGMKETVEGAWNVISGIVKTAVNIISTVIGAAMAAISAAWGFVWHTIEHLAKNAWSGIKKVAEAIWHWFTGFRNDITKLFNGALNWLYNAGKDIIMGLVHGISAVIHYIWDWATNFPTQVFNIVDGLYDKMLEVGKNLIIGIWNGIAGLADWLWNKVESFCSNIWNGIKNFFGISSPSKLMRDTVGKHIATGIAQGIIDNKHHTLNALQKLAEEAAKTHLGGSAYSYLVSGVHTGNTMTGPGGGSGRVSGNGNTVYFVTVQGTVVDTAGLFKAVQEATLAHGSRNRNSGLVFVR